MCGPFLPSLVVYMRCTGVYVFVCVRVCVLCVLCVRILCRIVCCAADRLSEQPRSRLLSLLLHRVPLDAASHWHSWHPYLPSTAWRTRSRTQEKKAPNRGRERARHEAVCGVTARGRNAKQHSANTAVYDKCLMLCRIR